MARKLDAEERSESDNHSSDISADSSGKELLNRRDYVKLSAATAATVLTTGVGIAGASSDIDVTTFETNFAEYAL